MVAPGIDTDDAIWKLELPLEFLGLFFDGADKPSSAGGGAMSGTGAGGGALISGTLGFLAKHIGCVSFCWVVLFEVSVY